MKTIFLIPVLVLLCLNLTKAQNDSLVVKKMYRTWVYPTGKGRVTQGALFEVKDSSVRISDVVNKEDYLSGNFRVSELDAKYIKGIKLRRIGAQGKGLLIGVLSGALVGIITTLSLNTKSSDSFVQDFQQGLKVFIPLVCIGIGTSIGGTIGGAKMNIRIKGNQSRFEENKDLLTPYSIKYNSEKSATFLYPFKKLQDTVVDVDSNIYHTMALGGQVWMIEDLRTKHFRDGSVITEVKENNLGRGYQYNWFAVQDVRNLCPAGWHVPSMATWTSLVNSLGEESEAKNDKEWSIFAEHHANQWWSSTKSDSTHAQSLYINTKAEGLRVSAEAKNSVMRVRCFRDY